MGREDAIQYGALVLPGYTDWYNKAMTLASVSQPCRMRLT